MKLSESKKGGIIYRKGPGNTIIGPLKFLAYKDGLLFALPIELPQDFTSSDAYLKSLQALSIEGRMVQILRVDDSDDWFKFPVKTLDKVKKLLLKDLRTKKPQASVESLPSENQTPPEPEKGREPMRIPELPKPPEEAGPGSGGGRSAGWI